ncbi:MAG: hypothetical protein ABF310_01970 [Paracoccaceae bacterium]
MFCGLITPHSTKDDTIKLAPKIRDITEPFFSGPSPALRDLYMYIQSVPLYPSILRCVGDQRAAVLGHEWGATGQ